jgi:hypothetical protein
MHDIWKILSGFRYLYFFLFFSFWMCFVNLLVYAALLDSVVVKYKCKYKKVYASGRPFIVDCLV